MPVTISSFSTDEFVVKWKEQFLSAALNQKFVGTVAPGTYRGFVLQASGSVTLTLDCVADSVASDHIAIVQDSSSGVAESITIRKTGGTFQIPLTDGSLSGQTAVVALSATYSETADTTASIVAYTLAAFNALTATQRSSLTVLGTVDVPGTNILIPATNVTHTNRDEAWSNASAHAVGWSPLIRNGSFEWSVASETAKYAAAMWESQTGGGTGTFTWQPVTAAAHTGSKSLEMNVSVAGTLTGKVIQYLNVPVVANQWVKVDLWKRVLSASTAGSLVVALIWSDSTGADFSETDLTIPTTSTEGAFVEVTATTFVPSGAVFLKRVELKATALDIGVATGAILRVDDIQVWLEAGSAFNTARFQERQAKAEDFRSIVLRPGDSISELAALFTFDPSTPASQGTVTLARRDQGGSNLPRLNVEGVSVLARNLSSVTIADGTASTDADFIGNTNAVFSSAIAALPSGGTIWVKKGTYTFASKLTISTDNIRIVGESEDSTFITGAISGDAVIDIAAAHVRLEHLNVKNTSASGDAACIVISKAGSAYGEISECDIYASGDPAAAVTYGIRVKQSNHNHAHHNKIHVLSGAALTAAFGIGIKETVTTGTVSIDGNRFTDNLFINESSAGSSAEYFHLEVIANGAAVVVSLNNTDLLNNSDVDGGNDPWFLRMYATKTSGTSATISHTNVVGNDSKSVITDSVNQNTSGAGAAISDLHWAGNDFPSPSDGTTGVRCSDGAFAVEGASSSYSNPASTTAVKNELRAANMPKAWGYVTTGGSSTVNDGFNILSLGFNGNAARITLAQGLSSANYVVLAQNTTSPLVVLEVLIISNTVFDIYAFIPNTAASYDLSANAQGIGFAVFGKQ